MTDLFIPSSEVLSKDELDFQIANENFIGFEILSVNAIIKFVKDNRVILSTEYECEFLKQTNQFTFGNKVAEIYTHFNFIINDFILDNDEEFKDLPNINGLYLPVTIKHVVVWVEKNYYISAEETKVDTAVATKLITSRGNLNDIELNISLLSVTTLFNNEQFKHLF